MDTGLADAFTSQSQKIRVITENWLKTFGYCPTCGNSLNAAKANAKVFDFECSNCSEQFELKSKKALAFALAAFKEFPHVGQ